MQFLVKEIKKGKCIQTRINSYSAIPVAMTIYIREDNSERYRVFPVDSLGSSEYSARFKIRMLLTFQFCGWSHKIHHSMDAIIQIRCFLVYPGCMQGRMNAINSQAKDRLCRCFVTDNWSCTSKWPLIFYVENSAWVT